MLALHVDTRMVWLADIPAGTSHVKDRNGWEWERDASNDELWWPLTKSGDRVPMSARTEHLLRFGVRGLPS